MMALGSLITPAQLRQSFDRLRRSAVVWSWVYNAVRLASGLILLPLVLNKFPTAELGMYYVFLSLVALVPLVDFGFAPTIGRFVSYAMGGAESIQAHGVAKPGTPGAPNYTLLWQLLFTTRTLYRYLTSAVLVIMGAWGTYVVQLRIRETAVPWLTWLAWAATLGAAMFEIYANWWGVFLRSMNQVLEATRLGLYGIFVRLIIAAGLLLCGAGLLSLPVGSFLGSVVNRYLARKRCLQMLEGHPAPKELHFKENLRLLWPNTWRLGLLFASGYLTVNANTAICLHVLGLAANARYGLSVQLLDIIIGMASVWTAVKWPLIGQYFAQHDLTAIQRLIKPRLWLQTLTFLLMVAVLLSCGPILLQWFGGGKSMLPRPWLAVLALNSFLYLQFGFWGTLISMENRLPVLWPTVASNILSLILSLSLIHFTSLGLGALVLGPLLSGSLFNYWYWPSYAARRLGSSLTKVLFG